MVDRARNRGADGHGSGVRRCILACQHELAAPTEQAAMPLDRNPKGHGEYWTR